MALAALDRCSDATINAEARSGHRLVRLAGLATGLTRDVIFKPARKPIAGLTGWRERWVC